MAKKIECSAEGCCNGVEVPPDHEGGAFCSLECCLAWYHEQSEEVEVQFSETSQKLLLSQNPPR